MSDSDAFFAGLDAERDRVFREHDALVDHRAEFPWLVGALGDPFAPVWFVAENPSLTQVRKIPAPATVEVQWSASPGDRLFRDALAIHGFKSGGALEPGGWQCYITDVIKSADIVNEWRARPEADQRAVAEAWAQVLAYELEHGAPQLLVVLGGKADSLLDHLQRKQLVPSLPPRRRIAHYSYLGSRPEGSGLRRGPMHPDRIAEWHADFAAIARSMP